MVVALHNEEEVIGEKLENSLALDYPADRLEIVFASDGSTDATNAIIARRGGLRPPGSSTFRRCRLRINPRSKLFRAGLPLHSPRRRSSFARERLTGTRFPLASSASRLKPLLASRST